MTSETPNLPESRLTFSPAEMCLVAQNLHTMYLQE